MIRNPQGDSTIYQYDDADRRTGILRQNGNRTTIVHDNASQITAMLHRYSGVTFLPGSGSKRPAPQAKTEIGREYEPIL